MEAVCRSRLAQRATQARDAATGQTTPVTADDSLLLAHESHSRIRIFTIILRMITIINSIIASACHPAQARGMADAAMTQVRQGPGAASKKIKDDA
ncbi:hypothetical protein DBR44_14945 [Aquitalea sp. FJL05]|nr:hypothetical protein DBR44_14945 [Aquitalea sp. FJL05]